MVIFRFQIMFVYLSASVILVGLTDAAENFLVSGLFLLAATQLDVLSYELAERRDQGKVKGRNEFDYVAPDFWAGQYNADMLRGNLADKQQPWRVRQLT